MMIRRLIPIGCALIFLALFEPPITVLSFFDATGNIKQYPFTFDTVAYDSDSNTAVFGAALFGDVSGPENGNYPNAQVSINRSYNWWCRPFGVTCP